MNFPVDSVYIVALLTGLAGGFAHCIGMCGIFVISYAGIPDKNSQGKGLNRHLMFHAGRLGSLGSLGLLGGIIGELGHRWASIQGGVSIAAGVLMIGLALGIAGILPWFKLPEPDVMSAGGGVVRRLFLRALRSQSATRPLLIGVFVGLLPCGLTYNALLGTFSLRPISGAVLMLLFGIGTIPGLLTLGLFGNKLFGGILTTPRFRSRMTLVAAVMMGILGAAFIWRGVTGA